MKINHPSSYDRFVSWATGHDIDCDEIEILWRKLNLRGNLKGCDPVVAAAIKRFSRAFTSSHTTKSKRYSVWTLIRNNVAKPLSTYLQTHLPIHGIYELRVLACADSIEMANALQRDMENLKNIDQRKDCGLAQAMQRDMSKLEDLLRYYIRPNGLTQADEIFQATLESVRYLCHFCQRAVPNRSVNEGDEKRDVKKITRPKVDQSQYPYCEICYRLCQRIYLDDLPKRMGGSAGRGVKSVLGSERYCCEHDPCSPKSQYQTDHDYRKKFHAKLKEIYGDLRLNHKRDKWIELVGGNEADLIRRYAYEYVRAPRVDDRVKVWQLHKDKSKPSQSEIAKALGMSRQWVHKILEHPLKSIFGRNDDGELIDLKELQQKNRSCKAGLGVVSALTLPDPFHVEVQEEAFSDGVVP